MPLEVTISKGLCENNDEFWVSYVFSLLCYTALAALLIVTQIARNNINFVKADMFGEAKPCHYIMYIYMVTANGW